ncbi:MAG: 50S ribosomal protein L11 methyltransferase [Chitinophagaceae bacterium]
MTYIQLIFPAISPDQSDMLIAALSEAGFEGFEEEASSLKAFVAAAAYDEAAVQAIAGRLAVRFTQTTIGETNWNQVWESNFSPVVVEDFVAIRAGFHAPFGTGVGHEIVITPKMSFGTGHHATTWMMIRQMKEIDFDGKSVFDFGTGTGILAILAARLGARRVVAIDHDEWSIENSRENILQNQAAGVEIRQADTARLNEQFEVILANINKNVILDNLAVLAGQLAPGGILLLSGLLATDEPDMLEATKKQGLELILTTVRNNWLCMKLTC